MHELMREMKWTEAEKKLSRRAFEVALQAELAEVLQDFKARAAAAQTPGDMWPVEHFLNQRRRDLDAKYDYRYSQLISVFGRLIREGRLTEGQLEGCLGTSWSSFGRSRCFEKPRIRVLPPLPCRVKYRCQRLDEASSAKMR